MGADDEYFEVMDRGWEAPKKFVCIDCVEDNFLKEIIKENLASHKCNYCGKGNKGYIAAPVEAIMPAISSGLHFYFNDPDSASVPYDHGYAFEPNTTTYDALQEISLKCQNDLFIDISDSFHIELWTKTADGHWAGTHFSDYMSYAWKRFERTVKHEYRYFFLKKASEDYLEELTPVTMLESVGQMATDLALINILPAGTELFRVRIRNDNEKWKINAKELGPPLNEQANAGRMNPAGISYFYLAKEQQTALAEVVDKPPCKVACAKFRTCRNLLVLDLCNHPVIPSIFDADKHEQRELIYFLLHFINEISRPIAKNGREHIDYVASQIVSEYFAKEFRITDGQQINGLCYPSTICPGGTNIVLFPPSEGYEDFFELAEFVCARDMAFKDWNDFLTIIL